MIDFATLNGLTVPEGVVVKIEANGMVLWELQSGGTVVLEVAKITSNTYAGSTTYKSESFILLDIYPKSGGTVDITYGGLTKTITDDGTSEEPNAQQVFFGTFNGVADEVETPASGTLTITGACRGFGCGSFQNGSKSTSIGYFVGITEIVDFGDIEIIPSGAFAKCTSLTDVEIPPSVNKIGITSLIELSESGAFYNCSGLKNIVIPNGVELIGGCTFYGCTALKEITIPATVRHNGSNVFRNCTGLESVTLLGSSVFYGSCFRGCVNLKSFAFDEGQNLYYADGAALFNAKKTTLYAYPSVVGVYDIPPGVEIIDDYAFADCTGLTEITLPSSVTHIGSSSFYGCTGLTEITLPSSVTHIGSSSFSGCNNLTTMNILATTPPKLSSSSIFDGGSCTFIVPAGCGEAYKAAEYWSEYADRIVEAS